jgi:hypothetical protein
MTASPTFTYAKSGFGFAVSVHAVLDIYLVIFCKLGRTLATIQKEHIRCVTFPRIKRLPGF